MLKNVTPRSYDSDSKTGAAAHTKRVHSRAADTEPTILRLAEDSLSTWRLQYTIHSISTNNIVL